MSLLKIVRAVILSLLVLSFPAVVVMLAQNPVIHVNSQKVKVTQYELNASNIKIALGKIARDFETPIGLEVAESDDLLLDRGGAFVFKDETLEGILDVVVKHYKYYRWESIGGVINVIPNESNRDLILSNLLSLRLKTFTLKQQSSAAKARSSLIQQPIIQGFITREKMHIDDALFPGDLNRIGLKNPIDLKSHTVREILNEISLKSDARVWIVNRYGPERKILLISF